MCTTSRHTVSQTEKLKYKNMLLAVADMEWSVEFYKKVSGLRVIADFGANKTLTGGPV